MQFTLDEDTKVEIVEATNLDISDIFEIWEEVIDWHASFDQSFSLSEDGEVNYKMMLQTALIDPTQVIYVAKIDNKVVGFVYGYLKKHSGFFKERNTAHISDLAVAKEFRCKGIGSLLINFFEKNFARIHEADEITLYVHYHNKRAQKFYRKHNFETKLLTMRKKLLKS